MKTQKVVSVYINIYYKINIVFFRRRRVWYLVDGAGPNGYSFGGR